MVRNPDKYPSERLVFASSGVWATQDEDIVLERVPLNFVQHFRNQMGVVKVIQGPSLGCLS